MVTASRRPAVVSITNDAIHTSISSTTEACMLCSIACVGGLQSIHLFAFAVCAVHTEIYSICNVLTYLQVHDIGSAICAITLLPRLAEKVQSYDELTGKHILETGQNNT